MSKLVFSMKDLIVFIHKYKDTSIFHITEDCYDGISGTVRPQYMEDRWLVTGNSYSLEDNRIQIQEPRQHIFSINLQRCQYCNRKNNSLSAVCDGCGGNL